MPRKPGWIDFYEMCDCENCTEYRKYMRKERVNRIATITATVAILLTALMLLVKFASVDKSRGDIPPGRMPDDSGKKMVMEVR